MTPAPVSPRIPEATTLDEIDRPEDAASWLRQASRFADARSDQWIVVGTGRGWMQMLSRLLRSTDWRPERTIVVAARMPSPPS